MKDAYKKWCECNICVSICKANSYDKPEPLRLIYPKERRQQLPICGGDISGGGGSSSSSSSK